MAGRRPERCSHLPLHHSSCLLSWVHPEGAPNDRRCIYDRFGLTSSSPLLWNPGIFLCRRISLSVSCSVQQKMYTYFLFSTHTSMSLFLNDFFSSLCHSDTYRFTLRPLCLFITSTSHFLIFSPSPSLSINQSWAAPAD